MGVTGLWKLIEASGKPVPLETLENKVLAVDISIWLHQVTKGFQDNKGGALAYAHLLGIFHRLCKLLYYRIKPVFVFDGQVPHLKKDTIAKRNQSRNKLLNEAERLQDLLLKSLAREKVVQKALGSNAEELLTSPQKPKKPNKSDEDDMFKLPEAPDGDAANTSISNCSSFYTTSASEGESSFDDNNLRHSYHANLQSIDVTSAHFKSLPADVRFEILTDIKETRKQSSWAKLHEFPSKSDDFSSFQIKRLLKRRQVQVSLEEAEQQMGGKSLTLSELRTFLTEEGVVTASTTDATKQIASDEHTRYLLVRDLKRAIEKAEKVEQEREANAKEQGATEEGKKREEELGEEFKEDLRKAIELSLDMSSVYNDEDYEGDGAKMSKEQRQQLRSAALSLARAYMIEYGGMNDDDIKDLLENTQTQGSAALNLASMSFKHNDSIILKGSSIDKEEITLSTEAEISEITSSGEVEVSEIKPETSTESKGFENFFGVKSHASIKESDTIAIISSDSDSDSDLVEVMDEVSNQSRTKKTSGAKNLEIFIDLDKNSDEEEDIFKDFFENQSQPFTISSQASDNSEIVARGELQISQDSITDDKMETIEDENRYVGGKFPIFANKVDEQKDLINRNLQADSKTNEKEAKRQKLNTNSVNEKKSDAIQKEMEVDASSILVKLKADVKNIPKITLDDIDIKSSLPLKIVSLEGDTKTKAIIEANIETNIKPKVDPVQILENLKKEALNIPKITLNEIKSEEIIEILDNDAACTESDISKHFQKQYVVKRTPEKVPEPEDTTPTKVSSPFFVKKTPGSSSRKKDRSSLLEDITESRKEGLKVSKVLFDDQAGSSTEIEVGNLHEQAGPSKQTESSKPVEPADLLNIAAQALKENKTTEELETLARDISMEKRELEQERNRQNRMGMSITEKMNSECMSLLQLFGIPYIVAPMEAEAQCAFLDATQLTDGTITDDSDIWLFGGRTVYKNFFNQKKHVLEFKAESIEKNFSVDREKLIQLAILVGSDYTTGINGIGAVTALEILATFPTTPAKEGETTQIMSVLSSLRKFRDWWRNGKSIGVGGRTALKSKLKNIEITENFPNAAVVKAYLDPKIDSNKEAFTWGTPDVETIREFTKKTFGWTRNKTDDILQPVIKKMNEKKLQKSIKSYFSVTSSLASPRVQVSKRVQRAINKISGVDKTEEEDQVNSKKPRLKKLKEKLEQSKAEQGEASTSKRIGRKRGKKAAHVVTDVDGVESSDISAAGSSAVDEVECSPPKVPKVSKNPIIPSSTHVIPQREKDIAEMQKRKEEAAQLLKKTQKPQRGRKRLS